MKLKKKTHFNNKTEEWLVKKKNIPMTEDQELLDEFNCGYSGNIVVTGKLYVTNNRVCFYSPFNDKNIFFESTFIHIPKEEILKIEKKHNAKIFDNSIQITKKNLETVFFTSFVSRNHCYDLMISHLIDSESLEHKKTAINKKSDFDYDTQFLASKIVFQEFEYLVNSFSCGLATKINIMGRIYITNKRIFFFSLFNEQGTTQSATQVNILSQDILRIQKRYNTLIFDNSILIISKKGSFFFTSFLARDRVFNMLLDVFVYSNEVPAKSNQIDEDEDKFYDAMEQDIVREEDFGKGIEQMNQSHYVRFILHQKQLFESQSPKFNKKSSIMTYNEEIDNEKVSEEEFRKVAQQNDDITEIEQKSREKQIMSLISSENKLEIIGQTVIHFTGLNALKNLRIFDSGQQFYIHGKKYSDFMAFFKQQIMNRRNVKISKWKPNILEYLNTSNIKSNSPLEFERDFDEMVKLEKTGLPFMPKEAKSREFQKLFIISKDKYIIESYVENSGAPYADSFHVNARKVVQTVGEGSVKITALMETVFKKKPMLSSFIESKCEEEGTKQQKNMFDAMKEYFENLESSKMKK